METEIKRTVDEEVEHLKELYPKLLTNELLKWTVLVALQSRIKKKTGEEKKFWNQVYNEIKNLK
jgi:hypothetical protein